MLAIPIAAISAAVYLVGFREEKGFKEEKGFREEKESSD